ncbi:unnamed protein product [Oikopleura dioica]|uniref:Uncharacterized protein n=1 Tax=Oikopleura dioica TaxID=34765 RepID=E4XI49_OIKDI|nr:unnamed protein product [Oikopleura dioica]
MTPENNLNNNEDQKQHSKRKQRHKDNDKNMKQYQMVLFSKVSHWPDLVSLSNLDQCLVCDRLLLTVILNSALNKIQSNPKNADKICLGDLYLLNIGLLAYDLGVCDTVPAPAMAINKALKNNDRIAAFFVKEKDTKFFPF